MKFTYVKISRRSEVNDIEFIISLIILVTNRISAHNDLLLASNLERTKKKVIIHTFSRISFLELTMKSKEDIFVRTPMTNRKERKYLFLWSTYYNDVIIQQMMMKGHTSNHHY
jgi:hypothetical protein